MKRNVKSMLVAAALVLASAGLANAAATYVYLTGSTAARNAAYAALNAGVFDAAPAFVGQGNATAAKCNYMTFSGNIGGNPYVVKCDWSGSEAGIADIAGTGTENFLTDAAVTSSGSPGPFEADQVDLAMADNSILYSKNPHAALTGTNVCIIPFMVVKEVGSSASLTNVTLPQFRQALTGGAKLALFTGNSADTSFVYVSGRNDGSGTRVNQFGETGYGIFTSPAQVQIDGGGVMHDFGGGNYTTDQGYESGGNLAAQLGINCSATPDLINGGTGISVIGFLGISDANSAIGLGATQIAVNGVFESPTAVIEGTYAFWGNEFLYRRNTASSGATTVFNKLGPAIAGNTDGTTTIAKSAMHATRNGPTSDPIHN